MLHRFFRGAAIARAKAASRLAEVHPAFVVLHEMAVERWRDARRHHGDAPEILRGLASALLLHASAAGSTAGAREALEPLDALARLVPDDPRGPLLRGMALHAISEEAGDEAGLREALALLRRAREAPNTILSFVALVLEVEADAQRALAQVTRDPRDARRVEELERRRAGIPVAFPPRR